MSNTHGVFQHRTGYFYTTLEEDFCEVFKGDGKNEICRAYITSILEHLTNKQYDDSNSEDNIWVYMSLPEMARRMRHAFSERTIHKELQGMIADGFLEKRRAGGKATMEYRLNLRKVRKALAELPEKQSCNSARYHIAIVQEGSCNSATSILQNDKVNLANLQPRVTNRLPLDQQEDITNISVIPSLVAHATENAEATNDATGNAPTPSLADNDRIDHAAGDVAIVATHHVVRADRQAQAVESKQTPTLDLLPPCLDETALTGPPISVPSASDVRDRPPQVMTAKQIEKQTRQRANDIMALYCQLEGRQVMRSKPNLDGATALAENGALDEDITIVIRRIKQDAFWKKQMTLLTVVNQFDSRLDEEKLAQQAQAPAPPSVPTSIAVPRPIDPVVLENRRLAARFAQPQAEREA